MKAPFDTSCYYLFLASWIGVHYVNGQTTEIMHVPRGAFRTGKELSDLWAEISVSYAGSTRLPLGDVVVHCMEIRGGRLRQVGIADLVAGDPTSWSYKYTVVLEDYMPVSGDSRVPFVYRAALAIPLEKVPTFLTCDDDPDGCICIQELLRGRLKEGF